jgi:HD superfamily phosphohydrolase/tRNA A-37 threonylcarbamoyl transferase component Bud32
MTVSELLTLRTERYIMILLFSSVEEAPMKKRTYTEEQLKPVIEDLVKKGYDNKFEHEGTGNWGEVYKVRHKYLNCDRAVKILLPQYVSDASVKDRFLGEAEKMIKLTHNHIINIFDLGNPTNMPYYVMEFVSSKHLGEFLETYQDLNRDEYLQILKQMCEVLDYIHKNNVVHLDIKAENILVFRDLLGRGIKLADFGLAHYLIGSSSRRYKLTEDIGFIPPSLRNLRGKAVDRSQLKPSQDLAYLGNMLAKLPFSNYVRAKFSDRQVSLLEKIMADLVSETFETAEQLSRQLEKISPNYPPTAGIPELAASLAIDTSESIRVPRQVIVPITQRIKELIELPEFQRLRRIQQLGPTSLIYPGATHTRFEHSLGAYSLAVQYLLHLLSDPEFAYCFDRTDLERLLCAVLLHDIGHYPFAHLLEELKNPHFPKHRDLTCDIICGKISLPKRPPKIASVAHVLENKFKLDPVSVAKLIKPTHFNYSPSQEENILISFLDGALDVDKQDYLARDSVHVGVEYAMHIDNSRLLRSLTVSTERFELAVTEKGKTAVEFLIMSRSAMFSEVYWHHTNRAATTMIQRALLEVIKHKQLKATDLVPLLISMSDEELLAYLLRNGPPHIKDLIPHSDKWSTRQVYKRIVTFASHYERPKADVYNSLSALKRDDVKKIESRIVTELNKKYRSLNIALHEILLDVPSGEEKLYPVQIVFPKGKRRKEISLRDITHFDRSIFDQFFKFTKKARVFCHPRLKEALTDRQDDIREIIAHEVGVPFYKTHAS